MERKIRVLVAKPGLDGHDRGAKIVARALRVVEAAIQEDVDVIGLSLLSGAHMTLFVDVTKLLKEKGMDDILVIGGGIIPETDIPKLKKAGVAGVFGPGTHCDEIVEFIQKKVKR